MRTNRSLFFMLVLAVGTAGWWAALAGRAQEPEQAIAPDAWVAVAYVPELVKLWPAWKGTRNLVVHPDGSTHWVGPLVLIEAGVPLLRVEKDGTVMVRAGAVLAPWVEVRCEATAEAAVQTCPSGLFVGDVCMVLNGGDDDWRPLPFTLTKYDKHGQVAP